MNQFHWICCGYTATNTNDSNFFGRGLEMPLPNAQYTNFLGYQSGYGATNAANSIFIGKMQGYADTVNNVGSGSSILIGESTSTGGYKIQLLLVN